MNKVVLSLAAIATAALSGTASAQPEACSCSPQELTLKINLSGTCPASITNVGTIDNFCFVSKDDGTTSGVSADLIALPGVDQNFDKLPTAIESISYYELNESLEVINQETTAVGGSVDEVTFTSATANLDPEEFLSDQTQDIVSAAVLVISGKNAEGISVKNTVSWKYDLGMCNEMPVAIGDTLGWVDVVGLNYAKPAFCPAAPATIEPTVSPTFATITTTTEATTTTTTTEAVHTKSSKAMFVGTKSSKNDEESSAKASKAKSSKTSTPGSYGDPIAYHSKASTKSYKVVSTHNKSSKTQKDSSSDSYGGYHSITMHSKGNKSGNSKQSTKSAKVKGTKSSKDSSSKATTSAVVVVVNSKQSTKSSKAKSAKAAITFDAKAKKPHEGSMSSGWSAGGGRW